MNETKHTKGPWHVVSDFIGPYRVTNEDGSTVAVVGHLNSTEAMANAELIAASTELLAALKAARMFTDGGGSWADINQRTQALHAQMDAAISKAEGQS